jgi:hypothetical protein
MADDVVPVLPPAAEARLLTDTVSQSLSDDLCAVKAKLRVVLLRGDAGDDALADSDLWGPSAVAVVLAVCVAASAPAGQGLLHFGGALLIAGGGCAAAALTLLLLGANLTLAQGASALGYCLCPVAGAALACALLRWALVRVLLLPLALYWAVGALARLLGPRLEERRRAIALYPCGLVYALLAWILLMD